MNPMPRGHQRRPMNPCQRRHQFGPVQPMHRSGGWRELVARLLGRVK